MTDQIITAVVTVVTAIIGVAILSVLVSRNSQTATVIRSATTGFSDALSTALSPLSNNIGIGGTPFTFNFA